MIEDRQQSQRKSHDKRKPFREFKEEDKVYIRDFTSSSLKWTDGVIAELTGPLSYQIKTHDSESRGQEEAGHTRRTSVLFTGSTALKLVNALNKPP